MIKYIILSFPMSPASDACFQRSTRSCSTLVLSLVDNSPRKPYQVILSYHVIYGVTGGKLRYDAIAMLLAHRISLFVFCPGTFT